MAKSKLGWIVLYEAPNGTTMWAKFSNEAAALDFMESGAAHYNAVMFQGYWAVRTMSSRDYKKKLEANNV